MVTGTTKAQPLGGPPAQRENAVLADKPQGAKFRTTSS